ncbi:unnamed protein product [Spirodela intermedia]|uniref:Sugar phosphate transporter domain-containing protein n=1 Tax=Spirodela intermedia TaxID=51605 RepID=A0A7I8JNJ7_SPIIN|nr:unnamed protein product [Spirodela intermedia]CAA6671767.1 unnamed protein product [Spirodela intermedia]
MADDRLCGRTRAGWITYAYLLLYISLSGSQIFFNKVGCSGFVLQGNQLPFPVALTLLHMIFSSVLCFIIAKVFKLIKIEEGITSEIYLTSVIPIGAMFAMTLWLGNSAYLYISVAFAQMLKAIMPVAVFILGVAVGLEVMSCRMLFIMSVISFGVIVASYGEVSVSWVGVIYQMGGVIGEALRLIFVEIFVKKKGIRLSSISVMYYVSPCRWTATQLELPLHILFLNCLCTFALNLSVFLVITHTSALTIRVTGVVRDWLVVLVSASIAGVVSYNNHKLKKEVTQVGSEQAAVAAAASNNNKEELEEVGTSLVSQDEKDRLIER